MYLNCLKAKQQENIKNISARVIADELRFNEVQVRKDFASVSNFGGRPKTGYETDVLIADIEDFLGYNNPKNAVLVGVGQLGSALLSYRGFEEYGLNIVAGFDINPKVVSLDINGKHIFHLDDIEKICSKLGVKIGIITVPMQNAQMVCNRLVQSGILAIWNFAPAHLKVPKNILVHNENMAVSLAFLSKHLEEGLTE
ncbi:MAG: redox-sensing transcriptional repressor Rex [Ruminococcus sp.]|nr:redox-sensing transcriptional repressor Rex [Ruminococcus sp.]